MGFADRVRLAACPDAPPPGRAGRALALVVALAGVAFVPPAAAQTPNAPDHRVVQVVTFENQPAAEAIALVLPLLSADGSVELQPAGNRLVVRDSLAAISRILPVLRGFDHPARDVEVSLWLVHAEVVSVSGFPGPVGEGALPADIAAHLREHLPYRSFNVLARSTVSGKEGEEVRMELENGFRVGFRIGTMLGGGKLRLHQFELMRGGSPDPKPLLRSHLNLVLGGTQVVALSGNDAGKGALMIVIRGNPPAAAENR